jgi:hypothetical protein
MKQNNRFLALMGLLAATACFGGNDTPITARGIPSGGSLVFPEGVDMASCFAEEFYVPVQSQVEPAMPSMGLPFDPDEVFNLERLLQNTGLHEVPSSLVRNGFVVFAPDFPTDNPVRAFETVAGFDQPVFVSAGIPLHMLHIFFDQILQQVEQDHLANDLHVLCESLYRANIERGASLGAAYFAVPLALLDPDFVPDPSIADEVARELELIDAHAGFEVSPVFGYSEDYSQYVPRGHYTASPALERYFRSMMWLGRLTLLLNGGEPHGPQDTYLVSEEAALAMTACAVMTVSDLHSIRSGDERLLDLWARIYEITAFFAGFADDLSVPEYTSAAVELEGSEATVDIVWSTGFYRAFRELVNTSFAGPSIYSGTGGLVSMPDAHGEFDPGDLAGAFAKTTGFRFLGQRYTPDSEILGKLVFPSVGADASGRQRFMPTGLDVAAAFGSSAARHILERNGDFEYANYGDSLAAMTAMVEAYTPGDWHATLYMSWLHCLHLLQKDRGEGYPDFMRTDAWAVHTLTNFLASWAMLRHDTILYAKQSYSMEAGCAPGFDEPLPSAGFVEPVPEVYAELTATLEMARRGLEHYGLMDNALTLRFNNAANITERLQAIAETQLKGEAITTADADFLKSFAGWLESAIAWEGETSEGLETTLIADVHTDQNSGSVLEVASGNLDYCIVVYMRPDGHVEAAVGPVLSYYEFTHPMSDRLTDEAWREMLQDPAEAPPRHWGTHY